MSNSKQTSNKQCLQLASKQATPSTRKRTSPLNVSTMVPPMMKRMTPSPSLILTMDGFLTQNYPCLSNPRKRKPLSIDFLLHCQMMTHPLLQHQLQMQQQIMNPPFLILRKKGMQSPLSLLLHSRDSNRRIFGEEWVNLSHPRTKNHVWNYAPMV